MVSNVITDYARNRVALILGGSITTLSDFFMIGSGSGTVTVSSTTLTNPTDRQAQTAAATFPALNKFTVQGDWNSVEMSGLAFKEFGLTTSGTGTTGSMWSIHVIPSITFDGTNELRIEEVWEIQ